MITLVLGGTRSGKSRVAESLAAAAAEDDGVVRAATVSPGSTPPVVTYLATAAVDPGDADHVSRIDAHRRRRPDTWATVECTGPDDLERLLRGTRGVVLVDSLGTWVTRHADFRADPGPLTSALRARTEPTVVVSEEVGLAVHPATALARRYVDAVGLVNQAVADVADRAVLVVAGRVLDLARFGHRPGTDDPC